MLEVLGVALTPLVYAVWFWMVWRREMRQLRQFVEFELSACTAETQSQFREELHELVGDRW